MACSIYRVLADHRTIDQDELAINLGVSSQWCISIFLD